MLIERCDVRARDKQHMDGCLRIEVAEGDAVFVFVNFRGVDFARRNTTKDAILVEHKFQSLESEVWSLESRIKSNGL